MDTNQDISIYLIWKLSRAIKTFLLPLFPIFIIFFSKSMPLLKSCLWSSRNWTKSHVYSSLNIFIYEKNCIKIVTGKRHKVRKFIDSAWGGWNYSNRLSISLHTLEFLVTSAHSPSLKWTKSERISLDLPVFKTHLRNFSRCECHGQLHGHHHFCRIRALIAG